MKEDILKEKIRNYSVDIMKLSEKHYLKLKDNINEFTTGGKIYSDNADILKSRFEQLNFPYLYIRNKKRNNLFFNVNIDNKGNLVFKEGKDIITAFNNERIIFNIDGIDFAYHSNSYEFMYPLFKNKENILDMLVKTKVKLENIISLTKAADMFNHHNNNKNEKTFVKPINIFKKNLSEQELYSIISCIPTENLQHFLYALFEDQTTEIDINEVLEQSKAGYLSTMMLCSLHKDMIFTNRDIFKYYKIKEEEMKNILNPIVLYKNLNLSLPEKTPIRNNGFKI